MEDPIETLAKFKVLPDEEIVLARALIRRGLVPPEHVLDATRVAAELAADSADMHAVLKCLVAMGRVGAVEAREIEEVCREDLAGPAAPGGG
jgi:hypothetical protein